MIKNLSDEQVNTLKKIGGTLRDRREEMGYTIETIAEITRISSTMLHALETADYEEFTGLIFVRGFLRNYCKLLEIDSDWMIQELNNIYDDQNHNLDVKIRYADEEAEEMITERNKQKNYMYVFAISITIIIILIAGGYLLYNFIFFSPGGSSSANSSVIEINAKAQTNNEQETERESTATPATETSKTALNLNIDTLNEGWIRVELDEQRQIEAWLKQGFSYQWNADNSIRLIMGKGDLAKVSVNGKEQYIAPEEQNKLLEITFKAEDFINYL